MTGSQNWINVRLKIYSLGSGVVLMNVAESERRGTRTRIQIRVMDVEQ